MQRLCAALLVALFGFTPTLPLMRAQDDSEPHACCRREGKHHCGMKNATDSQQGPAMGEKCPYRSIQIAVPVVANAMVVSPSSTFYCGVAKHPTVQSQTEALLRISHSRSRQKRGPPALFS